ncbi:MAG: phage holin family protein [Bacteroidaceae bacterium]|nr:phage holin family protein [Bacteroidaceae bacterium]
MDGLKIVTASLVANVVGLLFPIWNDIFGLVLLFVVNFIVGLLADVCNRREWSFRKAFCFFRDAGMYFAMVACIYLLGYFKGEERAAVHCVSFMIYVAIYFYGTNILRNARLITNEKSTLYRVLNFLYHILSLKVLERNKLLKDYIDYEKHDKNMC